MKFNIEDRSKIITHWMLQSLEHTKLIAETPEWKEGKNLTAAITVNGVELPFEIVESYFSEVYTDMEQRIRSTYSNVEAEVQRRLEQRLQDEVQPILDQLHDLSSALTESQNLVRPYWERP